ncbi:MAG TPA: hypothetical protein VEH10_06125, partial [Thermoplasmata archaeon]|nr:hypothetical protein [Thermoplasmata archaeon]
MTGFEAHEGDLEKALGRLGKTARFAEALAESGGGAGVRVDSKSTSVYQLPRLQGVVFRVWTGKRWAEAATSDLGPAGLEASVAQFEGEVARSGGTAAPPGTSATTKGSWSTRPKRALRELGPEGTITLAKDIRGWAAAVPGIVEVQVRLDWGEDERLYLNSSGARCHQRTLRTHGVVVPIAMENGRPEFD